MTSKEFAIKAAENGYTGQRCEGWEWIEKNLPLLDDVFQALEYKEQNGMKYKCMPFLVRGEDLTPEEENAIGTAWYLNNGRERKKEDAEHKAKMLAAGFIPLTEEVVKQAAADKKRLEVSAQKSFDWMTGKVEEIYKPFVDVKGTCWLMKPKARSRGYYLSQFEKAFCRVV